MMKSYKGLKQSNCLTAFLWLAKLFVLLAAEHREDAQRGTHHKVLILGAGASGIAAANKLTEKGIHDFLVLEGGDEIGGRMKHTTFAGRTIEEGANWVQGTNGSWLWELNLRYGINMTKTEFAPYRVFDENGRVPGSKLRWGAYEKASNKVDAFADKMHAEDTPDLNMEAAFALSGWQSKNRYDEAVEVSEHDWEFTTRSRLTSTKQGRPLEAYIDFKDEDYFVRDSRGWNYILIQLAKDVGFYRKIKLNTVVTEITDSRTGGVIVKTAGGEVYSGDYAIVTFSIGVLQSDRVKYQPPLPRWKLRTFYSNNNGIYTKIFLQFDRQFWPDTEYFQYVSDLRAWYALWMNMNYPTHFGKGPPYILVVTVFDEISKMVERQSKKETIEQAVAVLRKIWPDKNIPDPIDAFFPEWYSDPLFRGSYSSDGWIGVSNANLELMRHPLGRVHFSGEIMATKYNGWVHGGLLSGNETGEAVAHCIRYPDCCKKNDKAWDKAPVEGCTDPKAPNYNPNAEIEDQSCESYGGNELQSTEKGWAGKCEGLHLVWGSFFPGSVTACRKTCEVNPDCGVWQVDSLGACRHGVGYQCITSWGTASPLWNVKQIKAAGMIQHGPVETISDLSGVTVRGLRQVEKASKPQSFAIKHCRDICVSNRACRFWQYTGSGCFVEDPAAGFEVTKPPAASRAGILAGQQISHQYTGLQGKASLPEALARRAVLASANLGWTSALGLGLALLVASAVLLAARKQLRFHRRGGAEPAASLELLAADDLAATE
mmetsp:Transcript_173934/g.423056  ORF Transcript_173934/g.423056 Transcript_173934/m.423056 type:complete len:769 (-) Transcript_173934:186-2492(-)